MATGNSPAGDATGAHQRAPVLPWSLLGGGLMRLVNFHLGGALYTLPGIVLEAGHVKALVLLLSSGALTLLVYDYLADLAIRTRAGSLSRIVQAAFGWRMAVMLRVLVILNALGVVSAYVRTVLDVQEAAGGAAVLDGTPGRCFLATLVGGGLAVAFLEVNMANVMDWGSFLANASLVVLVAAFFWLPPTGGAPARPELAWWKAIVQFGPSLVFCFSSAEYVLRACEVADDAGALLPGIDPTGIRLRVRVVGALGVAISAVLYLVVGFGGVACFGAGTKEDILSNFQPPSPLFAVILGVNGLSLVLSFPVFVEAFLLYLRELLEPLLSNEAAWFGGQLMDPSRPMRASAWVVPLAFFLVQLLPGLRQIITLVSSITDYYFMFVFPPLAYLLAPPRPRGGLSALLSVVGLLLAGSAAIMGIVSFFDVLVAG